jgi:hypothetical protein
MQAIRSAILTFVLAVIVLFVACAVIARVLTPASQEAPLEW